MADSPLRDVVRREAETAGVDPDLALKIVDAENNGPNWKTGAKSGKGAMGLMQLMPATAKAYGVTNPYDPLQNIKGGVALLKDLSQKYPGRPDLIAAAYNAGEPAVNKAGGVPDFAETKAYVERVDPFSKWRTKAETPAGDPFAKWRVKTETKAEESPAEPTGGDEIVGMRTDPQARAERINRNLAQQQQITKDTLLGMPAMGEAVGATLRGIGALTTAAGRATSGFLPRQVLAGLAHYVGGWPAAVAAEAAPEALQATGKATSAAGRGVRSVLGRAPTVAEAAAPAAETPTAAIAGPGPGGQGWYKPWEGAERERILGGAGSPPVTPPKPASVTSFAEGQHLSKVWKAMDSMGVRLRADEMPRATQLVKDGMAPEKAVGQVLKDRGVPRAINIQNPAQELATQLGTPTDAEMTADLGRRARSGQKSLMATYGDK